MGDQPDVMDQAGRAKRLVLAVIVGASCAAIAYLVTRNMTNNTPTDPIVINGNHGVEKFVFYMTGLAFALGLGITLAITNVLANRKWRSELVAKARVVDPGDRR